MALLLPAVRAAGVSFTVTDTVPVVLQPPAVAVTVYVPPAAVVVLVMVGFCRPELKLLGPVQAKDTPDAVLPEVRPSVLPEHIGELLPAVRVGPGFTTTVVVAVLVQLPIDAVTV